MRGWGGCLTIKPGPWPATILVLFFILRGQSYVSNPVARSSHFRLHLGSPSITWTVSRYTFCPFILSWAFNSAWLEFGWAHPIVYSIYIYMHIACIYTYIWICIGWKRCKHSKLQEIPYLIVSNKHKAPYRRSKYKNRMFLPQRQQRNTLLQEFEVDWIYFILFYKKWAGYRARADILIDRWDVCLHLCVLYDIYMHSLYITLHYEK